MYQYKHIILAWKVLYRYKGLYTGIKELILVSILFCRYNPRFTARKELWREKLMMRGEHNWSGLMNDRVFGVKRSKPVGISE
jgi:hypothetical protein